MAQPLAVVASVLPRAALGLEHLGLHHGLCTVASGHAHWQQMRLQMVASVLPNLALVADLVLCKTHRSWVGSMQGLGGV